MLNTIIPQFFTTDLAATLKWYKDKLGFETDFIFGEPTFYGGVQRDGQFIYFRHQDKLRPFEVNKYEAEYLDTMILVGDIDGLYKEFQDNGVEIPSPLGRAEWGAMSFTVKDPDGRLLGFAEMPEQD